jgi:ABC-2 type transport system ATP-binding protein
LPIGSDTQLQPVANVDAQFAVRLDETSVRFEVPMERIASFKEYAIRRLRGRIQYREVWALRRLHLSVQRGEAIGVIGRNGVGKSTLLRVIAGVLRPTSGRVRVRGRVAALIEIGGAFHPELTGRENVFLNGTLLGRSMGDIRAKFDEIVDFAELGDFIEAPIRTYSTGMMMRLGFSVATAWDADVLLVDEVLAVGDEAFRAKCALRIAALRKRSRTALVIVSHDLNVVLAMCDRAIWLENGRIRMEGVPSEVTRAYHAESSLATHIAASRDVNSV